MSSVASPEHYVTLGMQGIMDLLAEQHAVVWLEIEAKLADRRWETLPSPIQPHILTTARHRLIEDGAIEQIAQTTRGGRSVAVIVPTDTRRRRRKIQDAAARKRLLQTRFLTWSSGSKETGHGVLGPAGERAVHDALTAAAVHGYRLFNPSNGQVTAIFGAPVPGGSLDNAALLSAIDPRTFTPTGQYVVPVEVKNVRSWIYPGTQELHQLLDKSARLQVAHPDRHFLPVLVCRRSHVTTTWMAQKLGFYVINTKTQTAPASLAGDDLEEVRTELGYTDLKPYEGTPHPALVNHFATTLQSVAERTAERWHQAAHEFGHYFRALNDKKLRNAERHRLTAELQDAIGDAPIDDWTDPD